MANRTDPADEPDSDSATGEDTGSEQSNNPAGETEPTERTESAERTESTEEAESAEETGPTEQAHSNDELLELSASHPILLFDGVCNLCNRSIQFVIERDPEAQFRFAPLQSEIADELLDMADYEGETLDSVVLIDDGEYYEKSGAVIRTARHLGGIYRLLGPFGYVPRRLRNFVYDSIANRRYNWFGKRDQCMMPSPDLRERFLAGGPGGKTL